MRKSVKFFTIDVFAGCGGLSEGFRQAGFETIASVDMDYWACETLRTRHLYYELIKKGKRDLYNDYLMGEITKEYIYKKYPEINKSVNHKVIQATFGKNKTATIFNKIEASKLFHEAQNVHVLLGGPPCQPYSLVGRARDPFRMERDKRHFLYKYYLKILEHFQPDIFVYENVPGLFSAKAKGNAIFTKLLNDFSTLNPPYEVTPPLQLVREEPNNYVLHSADFLIPQSRKRLILIGYRKDLEGKNNNIKNVFSKIQKKALTGREKGCLTIDDAIGDLPELQPGEGNDSWWGAYPKDDRLKNYQIIMRKDSPGILNYKARSHMPSDLDRYRFFIEHHLNGNGPATLVDLIGERPDLKPDHENLDKFIDRFKVQWWNKPSSTIMAHISKDGHYYIHPDINQCRSFTVREAARCQSFPDNFKFEGPRTEQFKQVGNAVPPLLANVIAKAIHKELEKIYSQTK